MRKFGGNVFPLLAISEVPCNTHRVMWRFRFGPAEAVFCATAFLLQAESPGKERSGDGFTVAFWPAARLYVSPSLSLAIVLVSIPGSASHPFRFSLFASVPKASRIP